jgi:hypothetical protein
MMLPIIKAFTVPDGASHVRYETMAQENNPYPASSADGNPYEIPRSLSHIAETPSKTVPRGVLIPASMSCIAGTTIAGAIFGTFLFPIIGTVVGLVLALVTSSPISVFVLNIVRLTHGPAIRKSTVVVLAGFCGGLSGLLSVGCLIGFAGDSWVIGSLAACLGMLGGALATSMYLRTKTGSDTIRYTPAEWADLDSPDPTSVQSGF